MKFRNKIFTLFYAIVFIVMAVLPMNYVINAANLGPNEQNTLTASGPANTPEPPRVLLDTTYSEPTGSVIHVNQGDDLQAAINLAQPGQVIELQAGSTFYGNFTLPNKTGNGWIYIRSSAYSSLPQPGTRVTPADADKMARIVSPNSNGAIMTQDYAHNYRLIGLEVTTTIADITKSSGGLVLLGSGYNNSLDKVAHDLIVDRCYIHGNETGNLKVGVTLNGAYSSVIDSYISECHDEVADAQAIAGTNGPGPFKIVNNYLEGAGENIMFGGGDTAIQNMTPSDIEIRNNHLFKPQYWNPNSPIFNNVLKIRYTISDGVNPDVTGTLDNRNTPTQINTGWTQPGGTIKLTYSDSWDTVMDDITYGDPAGSSGDVTYSFDDLTADNQIINGVHGGIDFGTTGRWTGFLSSNGFTNCACYTYQDKSDNIGIPNSKVLKSIKLSSPLSDTSWCVKNLFELKHANRVLIEGNIMENNWIAADQWGYAVLFTPRNQGGTNPWVSLRDIKFTNNIVRNSNAAVSIMGSDYDHPSQLSERIEVSNNIFENIDPMGDPHQAIQMTRGGNDIVINHNDIFQTGTIMDVDTPVQRFVFTNNITQYKNLGISSPIGSGDSMIDTYFLNGAFTKNIIAGASPTLYTKYSNYLNPPATLSDVGFVNYNNGKGGDYHLSASSPYKGTGTDGKDVGADVNAIEAATAGVLYTGEQPIVTAPPTPTPTPQPTPTPTPDPNATPDPSAPAGDVTYSFDDVTVDNQPLTGLHGGIDFGSTGAWTGFANSNGFTGCACYTNDDESNTITIPVGKTLKSIWLSSPNAGSTFKISDGVNPDYTGSIDTKNSPKEFDTGWNKPGSTITIAFSDGWDTVMDDITYGTPGGVVTTPTPTPVITVTPTPIVTLTPTPPPVTFQPTQTPTSTEGPFTITFQQGVNGYNGVQDTRVKTSNSTNYISENPQRISNSTVAGVNYLLYKFDVSSLQFYASVTDASLDLYFDSIYSNPPGAYADTIDVYKIITGDIDFKQTTGYQKSNSVQYWGSSSAQTHEGPVAGVDYDGTVIAATYVDSATQTGQHIKLILPASLIQSWIDNPSFNYGIMLKLRTSTNIDRNMSFRTSEESDSAKRPLLSVGIAPRVEFTPTPTGTPVITTTPTPTPTGTPDITTTPTESPSSSPTVTTTPSPTPTPTPEITFPDIDNVQWAQNAIYNLAAKGIINGYEDGTFQPNKNISRAEFTKMLVVAFNIYDPSAVPSFSDIPDNVWYRLYVGSAEKAGLAQGNGNGIFCPNDSITREQMFIFCARAICAYDSVELLDADSPEVATELGKFVDGDSVDSWAKQYVATVTKSKLVTGSPSGDGFALYPLNAITRAEVAVVLDRALKL